MTDHPITPPPELVEQWREEAAHRQYGSTETDEHIAEQAARWGADMELEACCEVLARELICDGKHVATDLRAVRRPKPPSLKEQALMALEVEDDSMPLRSLERGKRFALIRRALESLPD